MKMKNKKEVCFGIIIMTLCFIVAILVAILVVQSKVPSKASNDGWLGFFGGLFGSFISGMIAFYVLYINRKDMRDESIKQQKISEMDKMESDLKDIFALLRIERENITAETYFLFMLNKIPEKYRKTKYYSILSEEYNYCKENKIVTALTFEAEVYKTFMKYREMYIDDNDM